MEARGGGGYTRLFVAAPAPTSSSSVTAAGSREEGTAKSRSLRVRAKGRAIVNFVRDGAGRGRGAPCRGAEDRSRPSSSSRSARSDRRPRSPSVELRQKGIIGVKIEDGERPPRSPPHRRRPRVLIATKQGSRSASTRIQVRFDGPRHVGVKQSRPTPRTIGSWASRSPRTSASVLAVCGSEFLASARSSKFPPAKPRRQGRHPHRRLDRNGPVVDIVRTATRSLITDKGPDHPQ